MREYWPCSLVLPKQDYVRVAARSKVRDVIFNPDLKNDDVNLQSITRTYSKFNQSFLY